MGLKKIIDFIRLMRPANIVTSVADVLAGIAISGYLMTIETEYFPVLMLCISTIGLYGGGIVFNDVFDAELDKIERPERAIPSGTVKLNEAVFLGTFLLLTGIAAAFTIATLSGIIAILIAFFALLYNKYAKHHLFLGPLNMGLCRGLNLLLGVSIIAVSLNEWYFLGIVPLIYIFSITMISQGEVHGSNRNKLYYGAFLYLLVISSLLYLSLTKGQVLIALIFIIPFTWMIFRPLFRAIKEPLGKNIGKAVKAGVISLTLMDAAWAAVFGSPVAAICIALLLPLSLWLAKRFAVT